MAPLFAGTADLVVGSRYVRGGSTPGWPAWRRAVSRAGAALAHPLTGLHDSMCGFFAIGRSRLLDSRRKPAVSKLFSRQCCARAERCASVKSPRLSLTHTWEIENVVRRCPAVFFRWLHAMVEDLVASRREISPNLAAAGGGSTSRGSRKVTRMHRARRGLKCRPAQPR